MTKSILKLTVVSAAQLLGGCTATMLRWDSMRMREEIRAADNTESSPGAKHASNPKTTTIYAIHDRLGAPLIVDGVLVYSQARPGHDDCVPGALTRYGVGYYYIQNKETNKATYTALCRAL